MILDQPEFTVQPRHLEPEDNSLFLCFRGSEVLLEKENAKFPLPVYGRVKSLLPGGVRPFELAFVNGGPLFSLPPFCEKEAREGDGLCYRAVSTLRDMDEKTGGILASAYHLWSWYARNRFCGRCGHALSPEREMRALRCESCGLEVFPTISPAVIVAITSGDSILLAQNAHSTYAHYALIAGYVEVGETLEHAVRREVMEEVGLTLSSLRYIADQPWGLSGSMMFAFRAEANEHDKIVLQESELSDARWFKREALEPRRQTVSVASELIERFRLGTL